MQTLLSRLDDSDNFIDHGSRVLMLYNQIGDASYLELGVNRNVNFNSIPAREKMSVDTNGYAKFTGTTDEFFEQLPDDTMFDIVYIDANHDYPYVVKDFNNSVKHCNKWILIHDCVPPTKQYTESKFCSDSFKVLYYLLKECDTEVYVMKNNFGLTLVRMPATPIDLPEYCRDLDYDKFNKYISTVRRYSAAEISEVLNER